MQSHINKILLFFLCLALFPLVTIAASPQELVKNGNAAYERGQYDEALEAYTKAGVNTPLAPWISFNKGAAYYRKGDFAKAEDAWLKAASKSSDLALEANCFFNLGNCVFHEAEAEQKNDLQKARNIYARSVKFYQHALDLMKGTGNSGYAQWKRDASENIEMVRLVMKSISDSMEKQRKHNKRDSRAGGPLKKPAAGQSKADKQKQWGTQIPKNPIPQGLATQEPLSKEAHADKQDSMQAPDVIIPPSQQMQKMLLPRMADDARSIVNEEKERNKNRGHASAGGSREFDKDW